MIRTLRWNGNDFVHTGPGGEEVFEQEGCITLADDYPGIFLTSMAWPLDVWEELAEHILSERERRREEEEEKQPERWYVYRSAAGGWAAELALSQDCNDGNMGVAGGQMTHAWLWAKGEKEAITKARELAVSVNVLTQEYLRP